MAYVRPKQVHGRTYYQLVESYRDGGKVCQRVLIHLGQYPSVEDALAGLPDDIEQCRRNAGIWSRHADKVSHKPRCSVRYHQFALARAVAANERAEGLQERLHALQSVVTNNVPSPNES